MSRYDNSDNAVEWFLTVLLFTVLLGLAWGVGVYRCHARWEGSGMQSQFRTFAGCQVQLPGGVWIPDDRIRDGIGYASNPLPTMPSHP